MYRNHTKQCIETVAYSSNTKCTETDVQWTEVDTYRCRSLYGIPKLLCAESDLTEDIISSKAQ